MAGLAASALVGCVLGGVGADLGVPTDGLGVFVCLALLGAVVAAREFGVVSFRWPQPRRASADIWAKRWGHERASILWGLDIGSFFTTWFTFSGAWWLVALAFASGGPGLGAALYAAYWMGRALTVWLAPWMVPDARMTPWLPRAWSLVFRQFQLTHAGAVMMGSAVLVVYGVSSLG